MGTARLRRPIVRRVTGNRMVTKVSERECTTGLRRKPEKRPSCGILKPINPLGRSAPRGTRLGRIWGDTNEPRRLLVLSPVSNGDLPGWEQLQTPSGPSHRRQQQNQQAQNSRPGQSAQNVPNHEAHRLFPPRGGNRERICLESYSVGITSPKQHRSFMDTGILGTTGVVAQGVSGAPGIPRVIPLPRALRGAEAAPEGRAISGRYHPVSAGRRLRAFPSAAG